MEPDETLYWKVRQGDMAAFDQLYARYERRLFGFVLRLVRRREEAEEVLHDAFLGVLRSRELSFAEGSFSTWIYRVARNLCLNRLRSRERDARARAALPEPPPGRAADEDLAERELGTALQLAVERLSPALSEVYHLRSSGMSYEEMAAALEIPVGTVKSRMNQMVQKLQQDVSPWIVTTFKKH